MRLAITGASGFVGTALRTSAFAQNHRGVLVSRRPLSHLPSGWIWQSRDSFLASPLDPAVECLIHLEVKQHVQNPNAADLVDFENVNVNGTKEWLAWAARHRINRFIFFSSIKAAGPSPGCQDESSSTLPDTPYGRSKLAAERAVQEWAAASPERAALILRPAVMYGPGSEANMLSLTDAIYRKRYFLVGRNENRKSLLSLQNMSSALDHLLSLSPTGVHLFYLSDEQTFTVAEIAGLINQLMGRKKGLPRLPLPLTRLIARIGDLLLLSGLKFPLTSDRLRALLENTWFSSAKLQGTGFAYPQSTRDGLAELVNWYLQNKTPA